MSLRYSEPMVTHEGYDRTQVGDKLAVHYKYVGDEKEIINVENLTHPQNNRPTSSP
jgi:hypothetical protein